MSRGSEFPLRVTGDQRLAEEWELVLLAQGMSPSLTRNLEGATVLTVPEENVDRARAALLAYESENPPKPTEERDPVDSVDSFAASAVAGLLILAFFSVSVISNPTMSWFERGSADAQKILNGELWRTGDGTDSARRCCTCVEQCVRPRIVSRRGIEPVG